MKIRLSLFPCLLTSLAASLLGTSSATAGQRDWYGPLFSNTFGGEVKLLPNGNVVVVDQQYTKPGGSGAVGAVYLFSPAGVLISQLTGSQANDRVGNGGITVLANGNFVIVSYSWDNGSVVDTGAVTWISGSTGLNGEVSAANSLVGTRTGDFAGDSASPRGLGGVTPLSNGNYVVASPVWDGPPAAGSIANVVSNAGAVTFCNGTTGTSGEISAANSLVGSSSSDQLGIRLNGGGVTEVGNGNYVVATPTWRNGTIAAAGAVTWCSGTTGRMGAIASSNSLIGSVTNDRVGGSPGGVSITVLTNGNYVVASPWWRNGTAANAGAVTWCSGTEGRTGAVSLANSLTGSKADDYVGNLSTTVPVIPVSGVIALTNGHYVVGSPLWDKGAVVNAGALTWADGTTGLSGAISESNSLTGTIANDQAGRATALPGGKYVAWAPTWDNGTIVDAGAVRLMEGTVSASGGFSATNSLVGTTASDLVGFGGIAVLTNGNFVTGSSRWDRGAMANAGAVTWVNAATGLTGPVTEANSLAGSAAGQFVGGLGSSSPLNSVVPLSNGNYVIASPAWGNGTLTNLGAVTWGNGSTGTTGVVGPANSITGVVASDLIGLIPGEIGNDAKVGVTALTNGNYVISSPAANQILTDTGAITWGNGSGPSSFSIGPDNTFFGTVAMQKFGTAAPLPLPNGNFALPLPSWKNGTLIYAGALRLARGNEPLISPATTADTSIGNVAGTAARVIIQAASPDGSRVYVGWPSENRVSVISLDFPNSGILEVRRPSGNLVAPGATFDFGEASLTLPRTISLELTNAGYEPLTLENPLSGNSQFTLTLPAGLTTLAPKEKILLPVTFTPATAGPHTALVRFTTNDPMVGIYEITVTGNGLANGRSTTFDVSGGNRAGRFGTHVLYLPNGNLVITDPGYDAPGPIVDVGAAYLYSPAGHLISTLTGSTAGDQVGVNGIKLLTNGNYLICSSTWKNNGVIQCGAVTWGSATTGVSGVVSATNSLVGSTQGDDVGGFLEMGNAGRVYPLPGGNYVIGSPRWKTGAFSSNSAGAVTWGNGSTGISGVVSADNSLVGEEGAGVGQLGIFVSAGGNYLFGSHRIPSGTPGLSGILTFGQAASGIKGILSEANSMAGFFLSRVTPLQDGSTILTDSSNVNPAGWRVGAVLRIEENTPLTGVFDPATALTGTADGDIVGQGGIVDLGAGRYAVLSPQWNGERGAITWCRTGGFVSGTVSANNSLVGSSPSDSVGLEGSLKVAGTYAVIATPAWDNGAVNFAGAVTQVSVATPLTGLIDAGNSLVGTRVEDSVGNAGITLLEDGNYVVTSFQWNSGEGAVTWVSGTTGRTGPVTAENSLTGGSPGSFAGRYGTFALRGSRYVVNSPQWKLNGQSNVGAITWMDGPTDRRGVIHEGNSLTGQISGDTAGISGLTILGSGHYLVGSRAWNQNRGAITWCDGFIPASGKISSANSLTGSTVSDVVGAVTTLTNGHYVIVTSGWDAPGLINAGAITWSSGTTGVRGPVSSSNSLVGTPLLTGLGPRVFGNPDGSFAVISGHSAYPFSGSVIFSDGRSFLAGAPPAYDMIFAEARNSASLASIAYHEPARRWAVGLPAMNVVRFFSFTPPTEPEFFMQLPSSIELTTDSTLDFGDVSPGQFSERTLTLSNRGGALLNPGLPVLTPGPFSWQIPAALPPLAAGETAGITLRFIAAVPGPALATLTIPSNDPEVPAFTVTLRGTGSPLPGQPFGPAPAQPELTALANGQTQLLFQGIPGRRYVLERSADLIDWPWFRSVTADAAGTIEYRDLENRSQKAFYRLRAQASPAP